MKFALLPQELLIQRRTKTLHNCLSARVFDSQIFGDQFLIFTLGLLTLVSNSRNSPCTGRNAVFCMGYNCCESVAELLSDTSSQPRHSLMTSTSINHLFLGKAKYVLTSSVCCSLGHICDYWQFLQWHSVWPEEPCVNWICVFLSILVVVVFFQLTRIATQQWQIFTSRWWMCHPITLASSFCWHPLMKPRSVKVHGEWNIIIWTHIALSLKDGLKYHWP